MSGRVRSREPLFAILAALATASCGSSLPATGQKPLSGLWSGQVQVSAPGFAWGPIDRLTLGFATDGTLNVLQFATGPMPAHTFGSAATDLPLDGTRDVPFAAGSADNVEVTVNTAQFASDHLDLAYRIQGIDGTPDTDYVEETQGELQAGVLHVTYSATGTILGPPIGATASGDLRPD